MVNAFGEKNVEEQGWGDGTKKGPSTLRVSLELRLGSSEIHHASEWGRWSSVEKVPLFAFVYPTKTEDSHGTQAAARVTVTS